MELIWCGWNVPFRSTMHLRLLRLLPPLLREVSPSFTCMDADSLDAEGGTFTSLALSYRKGRPRANWPIARADLAVSSFAWRPRHRILACASSAATAVALRRYIMLLDRARRVDGS